jgi:hypothetical protein
MSETGESLEESQVLKVIFKYELDFTQDIGGNIVY